MNENEFKSKIFFSNPLLLWFDTYGRKDLPWQTPRTPYRVWISEIMLQQTQVRTVIPYFNAFMEQFPTLRDLAQATDDLVLSQWSGLGYYSRARNLHRTAQIIQERYQGIFPDDPDTLLELPGIGPSTAAAIVSQAFNLKAAILDGNVKRVLTRFFKIAGWTEQSQVKKTLWKLAETCMPDQRCADYTQAIMDLGASCCTTTKPDCLNCPLNLHCLAFKSQEQHLYPEKKLKKTVPLHQQQFLVLENQEGLIYLEKRPPRGLWGGLWCLPAISMEEDALEFIKDTYSLQGNNLHPLIAFKHKFTHFHLEINAIGIQVNTQEPVLISSIGQWITKDQMKQLGLAKPTSIILAKKFNDQKI